VEKLLEEMLEPLNLRYAYERVKKNKGAAGIDGVSAGELGEYLKKHWPDIKLRIIAETYIPSPVRRVEIPKSDGGVRKLGIPNAVDRFIQQAMLQVLTPVFEPHFSENSYGFRPGRSAHQAVEKAKEFIEEGYAVVVDIDLEKFFDRVNHDVLMSRVARKVKDKRILRLIRRYLNAGIILNGASVRSEEGTPQGGPLSPLLANILLDDMDKELEKRGHRFCRYADDCNVYVKTPRSGERVFSSIKGFLEKKLKLKVNEKKSAVAHPTARKFLGFTFLITGYEVQILISRKSIERFKERIREITKPTWRIPMIERIKKLNRFLSGWINYYALTGSPSILGALTSWIRRRLRSCIWQEWKRPKTRVRKLIGLGVPKDKAYRTGNASRGDWRMSASYGIHSGLNNEFWKRIGLINPLELYTLIRQGS
jgi:RNA-directed DNA polymerase